MNKTAQLPASCPRLPSKSALSSKNSSRASSKNSLYTEIDEEICFKTPVKMTGRKHEDEKYSELAKLMEAKERILQEKMAEIEKLTAEKGTLEETLNEKIHEIETISQNREELEGEVKNLTKDLDDLKSRESSLEQEIELLNQDNKSLEEELTKIKDELAEERKTRK